MPYPDWDQIKQDIPGTAKIPMIRAGTPTFMRQPYAHANADLKGADVVIIGSAYVAGTGDNLWGVDKREWAAAAERVRQQSARYPSGYIQDFDLDVFEHLRVVDYGDAHLDPETYETKTYDTVIRAQRAVEAKVNDALDAGAVPIVISQNSPCGSYAIAKPIAERTHGEVGVISLDTHWDIQPLDTDTMDPRVAGAASWKAKMYEFHANMPIHNLVEIGERGMGEESGRPLLPDVERPADWASRGFAMSSATRTKARRLFMPTSTWISSAARGPRRETSWEIWRNRSA